MTDEIFDIILAEDNVDEAHLTMRTLKKNGHDRIRHLRDGEELMKMIADPAAPRPKLILLDLKMPKVDGIEVLRFLKSNSVWKTVPVVMLTSSDSERDIVESYELGVNAYIVKPVNTDNFKKAILDIGVFWITMNRTKH
jgi:two-component system, response regulator